jgi:hypothetical protein
MLPWVLASIHIQRLPPSGGGSSWSTGAHSGALESHPAWVADAQPGAQKAHPGVLEVGCCGSKRDERYDSTGLLTDK